MLEFIVSIGYKKFRFTSKEDAAIFAEIAKIHSIDEELCVSIEFLVDDPEEDQEDLIITEQED